MLEYHNDEGLIFQEELDRNKEAKLRDAHALFYSQNQKRHNHPMFCRQSITNSQLMVHVPTSLQIAEVSSSHDDTD